MYQKARIEKWNIHSWFGLFLLWSKEERSIDGMLGKENGMTEHRKRFATKIMGFRFYPLLHHSNTPLFQLQRYLADLIEVTAGLGYVLADPSIPGIAGLRARLEGLRDSASAKNLLKKGGDKENKEVREDAAA